MLREYVISEAMFALGIPTTRSLAVVASGEPVWRESALPGAILTRVAASHVRVGTFQYCASRDDREALRALTDHVIDRLWPACRQAERPTLALLETVLDAQARLVAQWLGVGFIHGVMNTDNMAISGETIDYGPCAFMDSYDPGTVYSSIDSQGRYAYDQQPFITQWNLARFAEALLPLIDPDSDRAVELAGAVINRFPEVFGSHWQTVLGAKLGLRGREPGDGALAKGFMDGLAVTGADWTMGFRGLSDGSVPPGLDEWHRSWTDRLARQGDDPRSVGQALRGVNPAVIPRNHRVEAALTAAERGDFGPVGELVDALADPFGDRPEFAAYRQPPGPDERVARTFCGT